MNPYHEPLRNYIVETFLFGDGAILTDETSFLQQSILDSTGMMELIGFLENTFEVAIQDDELVPENLDSITSILRFLERKKSPPTALVS